MNVSMTYENWREAIRQEYITMVNLSLKMTGQKGNIYGYKS